MQYHYVTLVYIGLYGTKAFLGIPPPLCVHMILLSMGLSLTSHFVKSLSFVCVDYTLLYFMRACVLNSRGQEDARPCMCLLPRHSNTIQPATFIHPSSPASSAPVAVFLSLHSPSPGTHVARLTRNSTASSQNGSPRNQASLPTHRHNSQGIV